MVRLGLDKKVVQGKLEVDMLAEENKLVLEADKRNLVHMEKSRHMKNTREEEVVEAF